MLNKRAYLEELVEQQRQERIAKMAAIGMRSVFEVMDELDPPMEWPSVKVIMFRRVHEGKAVNLNGEYYLDAEEAERWKAKRAQSKQRGRV